MAKPTPPEPSDERARIVDATYRVLATGESASVTEVLREAGLSTRAFYRHFDSRDELLLALVRREYATMRERLGSAAAAELAPPEALLAWITELLRASSSRRRRHRVSVLSSEEVTRAKGYLVTSRKLYHDMQEDLAALIDRGVRDGSLPWGDPGPDARSILAAVLEAFQEQVRDVAPNSADESITQVAGFALRALGADPRLLATPSGGPADRDR
jgi:AcrR family transcriptional regulator